MTEPDQPERLPPGEPAVRGHVDADGLLLDVGTLGAQPSLVRALAEWVDGTTLFDLSEHLGRTLWLLAWRRPVAVPAARAAGLPVRRHDDTWLITWAGRQHRLSASSLRPVPVASWVDLDALPVTRLQPLDVIPPSRPPAPSPQPAEPPSLRERLEQNGDHLGRRATPQGLTRQRRLLYDLARGSADPDRPKAWLRRIPGLRSDAVDSFLRDLYEEAAADLHGQGDRLQTAFVYADLLDQVGRAIGVLEQAGDHAVAAELAENRRQYPEAIRLWLRAGRPDRAADLARRYGLWAEAVAHATRAAADDPDDPAAVDLRAAWVADLLAASDVLGAVDAAWPVPRLRPLVRAALGPAIAGSGPGGARLLANVLQLNPDPGAEQAVVRLLADSSTDPGVVCAQRSLITGLAELPGSDPGSDRRLAGAALRAMLGRPGLSAGLPGGTADAWQGLLGRADPLLVADLAGLPTPSAGTAEPGRPWRDRLPDHGAGVSLLDAVAVPAGILVAIGELGLRLLSPSGAVRAAWDIGADGLAVADHGQAAVIYSRVGDTLLLHRLELPTRRLLPLGRVPGHELVGSFDGRAVIIVHDALMAVDTLHPTAGGLSLVWRDLPPDSWVLAHLRTTAALVALVGRSASGGAEVWRWSLPEHRLASRAPVEDFVLSREPVVDEAGQVHPQGPRRHLVPLPGGRVVQQDVGALDDWAEIEVDEARGRLDLAEDDDDPVSARRHGGLVTVWAGDGRLIVIDTSGRGWLTVARFTIPG